MKEHNCFSWHCRCEYVRLPQTNHTISIVCLLCLTLKESGRKTQVGCPCLLIMDTTPVMIMTLEELQLLKVRIIRHS